MGIKTGNGVMNFIYRFFIDVEPIEEEPLQASSGDPIEAILAQSDESLDKKWDSHFSSTSGKGKFKVDKTELGKDDDKSKKKQPKVEQRENDNDEKERE